MGRISEFFLIVPYHMPPVNGKKISPEKLAAKNFEKNLPPVNFSVDTSPVLLYKRFRSTTRE